MNPTANLSTRLERMLGSGRVLVSEVELQKYAISGCTPAAVVRPAQAAEVAEIVRFAASEKLAIVCCGSRSKLEIGMPPQRYDLALDLTGLTEVAHYDPADLTLSVDAGLPLADLSKVLTAKGQFLPLAVPCFATATIGGTVASGIDSMSRLQYGTVRDFLIGAEFVDGKGQLCKSGGRVVKNVTGYDIHKLLIGSVGTLAAITRLNFRTFPLPELRAGFLASFATPEGALAFRKELLSSGLPFSSVELFEQGIIALLDGALKKEGASGPELSFPQPWTLYAAFGGNEAVVHRIQRELQDRAGRCGADAVELLGDRADTVLSDALRESFDWLRRASPNIAIVRISQHQFTPNALAEFQKGSSPAVRTGFLLSGCQTAFVAFWCESDGADDLAALEHRIGELLSGRNAKQSSAVLLHAPAWLEAHCGVWGATRQDFSLMQRVKSAFDPQNVFSPGRFVGGI